jgi:adenylate cyclase, class 2
MGRRAVLEVEVKVRLGDEPALRRRLDELGARRLGSGVEEDLFFLHPMRDFAATDEAFRLRRSGTGLTLTYKGPRRDGQPGQVKARTEHEVPVGSDPIPLLVALDFHPGPRVRKHRERFRLGGAEVAVDHVEGAGAFVEVEVQAEDPQAASARVLEALRELGLEDAPREDRSYLEMVLGGGARA